MLQRQKIADDKVSSVRQEMRHLIDRAIISLDKSRVEAREETVREQHLRSCGFETPTPFDDACELVERMGLPPQRIFVELERLKAEDIIAMSSSKVEPETEIRLLRVSEGKDEG